MAGTFTIRPTSLSAGGTPYITGAAWTDPNSGSWVDFFNDPVAIILSYLQSENVPPDPNLAVGITDTGSVDNFDDNLRCLFTGACIFLDGSLVPVDISSLPAGFTVLSAQVMCNAEPDDNFGGRVADYFLQAGIAQEGPNQTNVFVITPTPDIIGLVGSGIGLRVSLANTAVFGADSVQISAITDLRIEGTYDAQSFQFNMQVPENPVATGDVIEVTGVDPADVKQIQTVVVQYEDGGTQTIPATFVVKNVDGVPILFITIPDITADEPPVIEILITSTQFSGSVLLGKLITIYFINAPGIYTIVPGKTSDTLYDITNGGTVDVKIPNPRFRPGFIGD